MIENLNNVILFYMILAFDNKGVSIGLFKKAVSFGSGFMGHWRYGFSPYAAAGLISNLRLL